MTMFREKPEFKLGRAGELLVSGWLRQRDWYVIPSYDYSGDDGNKAPKLHGLRHAYPVLDLDVCRTGDRRWVEVKTKHSAAKFWKTGEYQHGIEHYADYLRVQEETGNKAWLAILEYATVDTPEQKGDAGSLLMQSFAKLGQPQVGRSSDGKKMAYWPRGFFQHVNTFLDIETALLEVV